MTQADTASFTWEIEEFAKSKSYKLSDNFETKSKAEFWLELYVFQNEDNHFVIYLQRDESHTADQKVLWTISLINDKGKECYHQDIETKLNVESEYPIEGGVYHLNRDFVLDPSSGLLTDGKLTIKSTVTVLDDQNSANDEKLTLAHRKLVLAYKKTRENFQSVLDSSKYSDVVFVVGKKEFKLHKAFLASQSPVFAAMFDNDLEEAKQNRVEITDIDVSVFFAMIRFIYTANVDSVQQYAIDLFVVAYKYQLDSLKDICADQLGSNLTIDSVASILLVADMHSEVELKSKCIEFINNKNTTKVFATDGWKQLVKTRMELGLELYHDLANKFENK